MSDHEKNKTRWISSCHEAAHLEVALRYSHGGGGSAVVLEAGGGYARTADVPEGFKNAVVDAAGDFGGKLAGVFPVPPPPPPPPRKRKRKKQKTAAEIRAVEVTTVTREIAWKRAVKFGTDDERVDRFVIALRPGQPHEWIRTRRRICANARLIVWQRREAIRAIATTLFFEGEITIPKTTFDHPGTVSGYRTTAE